MDGVLDLRTVAFADHAGKALFPSGAARRRPYGLVVSPAEPMACPGLAGEGPHIINNLIAQIHGQGLSSLSSVSTMVVGGVAGARKWFPK